MSRTSQGSVHKGFGAIGFLGIGGAVNNERRSGEVERVVELDIGGARLVGAGLVRLVVLVGVVGGVGLGAGLVGGFVGGLVGIIGLAGDAGQVSGNEFGFGVGLEASGVRLVDVGLVGTNL